MQGIFDAKGINFDTIEEDPESKMENGTGFGRGFAVVFFVTVLAAMNVLPQPCILPHLVDCVIIFH